MRRLLAPLAAAGAVALVVASSARADVAPPPGYVEQCTLEKQRSAGEECYGCAAYFGNAGHCSDSLAAYGFASKCRSRGASNWGEVWCRKQDANAKPVPKDVLDQLSDASHKVTPPSPIATASSAPAATSAPPPAPAPTAPEVPPAATPAQPTPTTPPTTKPASGCGACNVGVGGTPATVGFFAAIALGAALALRRTRRR